ncbi:AfsA-related hotdog domain-containing protein [Amycolatopsis sp. H20-H5]|uniref:AfsA-related hotdog domain-containing protein n=1 Tax=Amycolatopsis sp. H20-H5 TaxID=3046309 RepID=UPI002DB55C5F|nr:AfsA-related hotdog domain-containing protein [Amycolatopsis sp. H20-H5]MEC3977521.1 AfsA-related hotdog domain-containing protein [Amycolatopsis sp. H20-H5]
MTIPELLSDTAPALRVPQPQRIMVVADRFAGFTHGDRVQTVSGMASQIDKGRFDDAPGDVRLLTGQGVGAFERAYVEAAIARHGLTDRIRFDGEDIEPLGRDVVHKHDVDNVLLARLRRTGAHVYAADIRVHGHNEMLADHQSGEHVQGMVIVEAARQLFLAAFESGYRDRWPLTNFYLVWNSVRLTFDNFLFPVPAQITCTVRELSIDKPDRQLDFELELELVQGGKRVAHGEIGFSAFNNEKIAVMERRKAEKAAKVHLGGLE